jgi:hypothetical protein
LLLLFIIHCSYSQERFLDASIRFLGPELNDPELMGYFNIGYAKYKPIIPYIFSPGVYIDAGLGLDWLALFCDEEKTNEDKNKEYKQLGFNLGFRLFNLIEISIIDINMFIGYNLVIGQLDKRAPGIIHNPIIGASIAIKFIGVEYSYYIPTVFSKRIAFHHLSILFHIKDF